MSDDNFPLCLCGKIGYPTEKVAEGVAKTLRKKRRPMRAGGRLYKDPRAGMLNHYLCNRTGSGLWHVGHNIRPKEQT